VTEQEEVRFRATIERGLGLLEEHFAALGAEGRRELDGRSAFTLYDTFGFPLDLTEVICAERGLTVDREGFERALGEARERSQFKGGAGREAVYREAAARVEGGTVTFTGYERDGRRRARGGPHCRGGAGEAAGRHDGRGGHGPDPHLGRAGRQVGDPGAPHRRERATATIEDAQKPLAGLIVHRVRVTSGELRVADEVTLEVDVERRDAIRRAHSATHLMHWALRQVLGPHAQQKGSVVSPDRLRFDFTTGRR
jgi:alanyl-tRNA synthetase